MTWWFYLPKGEFIRRTTKCAVIKCWKIELDVHGNKNGWKEWNKSLTCRHTYKILLVVEYGPYYVLWVHSTTTTTTMKKTTTKMIKKKNLKNTYIFKTLLTKCIQFVLLFIHCLNWLFCVFGDSPSCEFPVEWVISQWYQRKPQKHGTMEQTEKMKEEKGEIFRKIII